MERDVALTGGEGVEVRERENGSAVRKTHQTRCWRGVMKGRRGPEESAGGGFYGGYCVFQERRGIILAQLQGSQLCHWGRLDKTADVGGPERKHGCRQSTEYRVGFTALTHLSNQDQCGDE